MKVHSSSSLWQKKTRTRNTRRRCRCTWRSGAPSRSWWSCCRPACRISSTGEETIPTPPPPLISCNNYLQHWRLFVPLAPSAGGLTVKALWHWSSPAPRWRTWSEPCSRTQKEEPWPWPKSNRHYRLIPWPSQRSTCCHVGKQSFVSCAETEMVVINLWEMLSDCN